ncbi:leishmanolysin-like peptidase 2, partial [Plectropomus leopardus]|uniref:leishmanolysin-like peptidase 2 n=1 Tax=Plectropomus leopardus TaxID=160734 RepID=UPI001C4DB4F4
MASPSSQRLWVGMLVVTVVMTNLPGAMQKCIFDEVQAQNRVVRAAGSPHTEPGPRRASPQRRRNIAPPTPASPQPIRIQTWIPKESSSLSEAERERMEAAVEEAVNMVSSLLSVERAPGPLLLSRAINKYCKFLWRNSSTANYN